MGVMWTPTLDEDFARIDGRLFSGFDGAAVLVTGATGLVGSLLIKAMLYANERYGLAIKPIGVVRDPAKARAIFGRRASEFELVTCDLAADALSYEGVIDYIVHGAAVTTSRTMVERPVDVIDLSLNGTHAVLQLAAEKRAKVVYLSSMEVYGTLGGGARAAEDMLGFIDPLAVRSCYPEGKRLCENLCVAYGVQYGVRACIARLAQTFGAGVLPGENRAVVAFARSAAAGEDVVLKTRGLSEANYVYAADAISALLLLLVRGESGCAYNVANEACHMTVAEMAQLAIDTVGTEGARLVFELDERNESGFAPETKLFLDAGRLRALGWEPAIAMSEALQRLVAYLKEAA